MLDSSAKSATAAPATATANTTAEAGQITNKNRSRAPRRSDGRAGNRLAWLVVDGQSQRFIANLREFHDTHAVLSVSGLMGIPENFLLYVEPDCIRFSCTVIDRRTSTVRVRFDDRTVGVRYRDDHR